MLRIYDEILYYGLKKFPCNIFKYFILYIFFKISFSQSTFRFTAKLRKYRDFSYAFAPIHDDFCHASSTKVVCFFHDEAILTYQSPKVYSLPLELIFGVVHSMGLNESIWTYRYIDTIKNCKMLNIIKWESSPPNFIENPFEVS